jgi:hypothetical protein
VQLPIASDFRRLQSGPSALDFGSLGYVLTGMMVSALLVGWMFGWLANRLAVRRWSQRRSSALVRRTPEQPT